jgi:uncharacterized membrane protein
METLRELIDLILRWVHVLAAIMWIGNSLLFNWLDRNLIHDPHAKEGSRGRIWLLHSGGFYDVEKTISPGRLPDPLHWFKWQAYTTWLSGVGLLVVVYYMGSAALLTDPTTGISPTTARAVGIATLVLGWVVYDALWSSAVARRPHVAIIVSFTLLLCVAWALGALFTGRAAFLHTGALLGTIMAGNVARTIMPAQREQVDAVRRGVPPDPALSDRAKTRSIHNNYLTFPVVVLMLSSHFPSFHAAQRGWIVLGILVVAGATVRHILNIRFQWTPWVPALGATVLATAVALLVARRAAMPTHRETIAPFTGAAVSFDQAEAVVRKRCAVCHSSSPANRTFGPAPGGVSFDDSARILALAPRILLRAVETRTMPPGNATWMTEEERALLGRWLASLDLR